MSRANPPFTGTGIEDRLRKTLGSGLLTREPLRHHTTFRIGGPADYYFAARTHDQLAIALRAAREAQVPVFLLGGGSNLLVSDEGFRGAHTSEEHRGASRARDRLADARPVRRARHRLVR